MLKNNILATLCLVLLYFSSVVLAQSSLNYKIGQEISYNLNSLVEGTGVSSSYQNNNDGSFVS